MKILHHIPTGTLRPYPRLDDEPVVGLSAEYEIFDLIQEPPPEHDTATHALTPTERIDVQARRVTRGWQITALPAPVLIVSMTALRLTLIQLDLEPSVLNIIEAIPDAKERAAALAWWQTAHNVRRNHPLVAQLSSALGKTDAEVDAIFSSALQLSATL